MGERHVVGSCGCTFEEIIDRGWAFVWCPLHAAAPDLLAALEGLVGAGQSFNTETFRDPSKGDVWEAAARRFLDAFAPAVAAIAKAKGSENAAP